ncbi:MAG: hypothetical protein EOO01_09330 [Chitinophagaceae bacterium]|nr:MAG: hypothetical protein EOO01_09330 [Chitinophagaceae bacterium]
MKQVLWPLCLMLLIFSACSPQHLLVAAAQKAASNPMAIGDTDPGELVKQLRFTGDSTFSFRTEVRELKGEYILNISQAPAGAGFGWLAAGNINDNFIVLAVLIAGLALPSLVAIAWYRQNKMKLNWEEQEA